MAFSCNIHHLVEPMMGLLMVALINGLMFFDTLLQADTWYDHSGNETFVKYCLRHKKDVICKNMTEDKTVLDTLSNTHTYLTIEGGLLAIIFNILIGYLSDRYSRRLSMVIGGMSTLLFYCVTLINSVYLSMPIWVYYIAVAIQNCGGNFIAYFGAAFAFISDTSDNDSRTTRIAIADASLQIGAIVGSLFGGFLISNVPWTVCPSVSVGLLGFVLLYTIVVLKNPPTVTRVKETSIKKRLIGMVDLYTTKSPNLFRIYVLSGAYLIHFTAYLSYATFIMPYLLNPPFSWEPSRIGLLSSISSILNLFVLLMVPVWKKFGLSEPVLGILSCLITGAGFAVVAVAKSYNLILIGSLMKGASGLGIAIFRSRLSKLVQVDKFGQLFAMLGSAESLATLLGSTLLFQIYNLTRDWFEGFTFFLLSVLEICAAGLTIFDYCLQRRTNHALLINEAAPPDDPIVNLGVE